MREEISSQSPAESNSTGATSTYIDGSVSGDISIPNGTLLLDADYSRVGDDLVLEGADGQNIIVGNYFSQDEAATLINEAGAQIRGTVASKLAGSENPGQYAQTGAGTLSDPVGEIDKATGVITITSVDGVVRQVVSGDPVYSGDVIVTGDTGAFGIIFVDNSTMSMSENGRIVLDELIYNPKDYTGSQVFDIVQGAFVFTSGLIGTHDHDSVTVNTPVATIGIRGTKYSVDVSDIGGETTIVLIEGAISATNNAGQVIVDQLGYFTFIGGIDVMPTTQAFWEATSDAQGSVGRANLYHPEPQDLSNIDDLIDTLEDISTAGGGDPIVPLNADGYNQILNNGIGLTASRSGPLGGSSRNGLNGDSGLDDVDDDSNDASPNTTPSSTQPRPPGIYGSAGNDIITTSTGDDDVYALGGNDVIVGGHGAGDDSYFGGSVNGDSGNSDWVVYPSAENGVYVNLDVGSSDNPNYDHQGIAYDIDPNNPYIDTDTLYGIENIRGGDGHDIIKGDSEANSLAGGLGEDEIAGNSGGDTIIGDNLSESNLRGNSNVVGDTDFGSSDDDFSVSGNDTLYGDSDGRIVKLGGNVNIATAQNIDAGFVLFADENIISSTDLPHTSITGIGSGDFDFYEFTVEEAGSAGVFDIDFGMDSGVSVDAWIKIYDAAGNLIDSNDDGGILDSGSNHPFDSLLAGIFPDAGTYYISVGQYDVDTEVQIPMAEGATYELQISIENHAIDSDGGNDTIIGDNQISVSDTDNESALAGTTITTGSDTLFSSAGDDTIQGQNGNDTIIGDNRINKSTEATSEDGYDAAVTYVNTDAGSDTLYGGDGNDTIIGDSEVSASTNATTHGEYQDSEAYSDTDVYADIDIIDGGAGNDRITGDNKVTVSAISNSDGVNSDAESYIDIDDVDASDDTITGGDGNDTIIGDSDVTFTSTAKAANYDEVVQSDPSGDELYHYEDADADVYMSSIYSGNDSITGGAGEDKIIGDNLISASVSSSATDDSEADIVMYMRNDGDDYIDGGANNDYIIGDNEISAVADAYSDDGYWSEASVTLDANAGDDMILGGDGNDTIIGDNQFTLSATATNGEGSVYEGNYVEAGDDTIIGGAGNDTIYGDNLNKGETNHLNDAGDSGEDEIYGGTGTDEIHGQGDDDLLFGGSGSDQIFGGEGSDWIVGGTSGIELEVSVTESVTFNSLTNIQPNGVATGGGFSLFPTATNFENGDHLWGNEENATSSDGDKDVFVFNSGDGYQTIHDFTIGEDQLLIGGYSQDDLNIFADTAGTIITFGKGGSDAIKLLDITPSQLRESLFSHEGADADQSGVLSAGELIDLRDDLFSDVGGEGNAPSANEASVVLIAPMEPIDDDGGFVE